MGVHATTTTAVCAMTTQERAHPAQVPSYKLPVRPTICWGQAGHYLFQVPTASVPCAPAVSDPPVSLSEEEAHDLLRTAAAEGLHTPMHYACKEGLLSLCHWLFRQPEGRKQLECADSDGCTVLGLLVLCV